MKLLLDTHSFIWFFGGDARLPPQMRELIADGSNDLFLSSASVWEMGIKFSIGKLGLAKPFEAMIEEQLLFNDISVLGVALPHIFTVAHLPLHHRDPFDR